MGYTVLRPQEQEFKPPSWRPDEPMRHIVELLLHANMRHSRAHLWRYPPGSKGRLHKEHSQEEVFVAVDGMPSVTLGDPPALHEASTRTARASPRPARRRRPSSSRISTSRRHGTRTTSFPAEYELYFFGHRRPELYGALVEETQAVTT